MFLKITSDYLWIPIEENAPLCYLEIKMPNDTLGIHLKIAEKEKAYDAYLYTRPWIGQTLEFTGDIKEESVKLLKQSQTPPPVDMTSRPQLHFTADVGWINDPNGLIYHNGEYHLYYQFNPYDTVWNNMSWGHAKSRDLIHWTQYNVVMHPDEYGTVYSGCALQDTKNQMGYGEDTLLFFYTAAGGMSHISKEKQFTQRLAYSADGGKTLVKAKMLEVGGMAKETRDPKIFWHEETEAYIMILYIDGNDFGIYRSMDLIHWTQSQKITLAEAWECPDLFQLKVDDEKSKWVFWSADGFYFVGVFDGYTFVPEMERKNAYVGTLPYAAQTFSGLDHVVSIAWLRTKNKEKNYTGMMSIPQQLSLTNTKEGIRLRLKPTDELLQLRKNAIRFDKLKEGTQKIATTKNAPYECVILCDENKSGQIQLNFLGTALCVDLDEKKATIGEEQFHFIEDRTMDLRVIVDFGAIEIFANDGMIYLAKENENASIAGDISLYCSIDQNVKSLEFFELLK